jgi:hypothetical protein
MVAHDCHPCFGGKLKIRGSQSRQELISKVTRVKRAGGVVQVVEWPLSKCKDLSSNPNTNPSPKNGFFTQWFLVTGTIFYNIIELPVIR